MKITSEQEYEAALDESCKMTIDPVTKKFNPNWDRQKSRELSEAIREYKETATNYQIVCTKTHYAGGGMSFNEGELFETYYSRKHAVEKLVLMQADESWSKDSFEVRVRANGRSFLDIMDAIANDLKESGVTFDAPTFIKELDD